MAGIVSYAQNFEDVMLWRALEHVENGFYIDLGAQDPLADSVSMAFHEHGWKGIHVEPTPHYAQLLREQRPGDTVIEAAVGDKDGIVTFFEIPDTGISTADPHIAQQHRERGFEIREITVPCVRLSSIFGTCVQKDIHWMKVDVEGFERNVLASWRRAAARPWIVVVESTLPLTQIESHEQWEHLLLKRGYSPVYFDGLNRFYLSKEKSALKAAFNAPPNVFDGFCVSGTSSTPVHLHLQAKHKAELASLSEQVQSAGIEIDSLKQSVALREREYSKEMQARLAQLSASRENLLGAEQARAQREEFFSTQTNQLRHEKEELFARLILLEQAVATKLLERERLHKQHAEREHALELRLQTSQDESARQSTEFVKQLDAERASLLQQATTIAALHSGFADREREFGGKLLATQQELSQLVETVRQTGDAEIARIGSLHIDAMSQMNELQKELDAERISNLRHVEISREQTRADNERSASEHRQALNTLWQQLAEAEKSAVIQMDAMRQESTLKLAAREREISESLLAARNEASEAQRALRADLDGRALQQSRTFADELATVREEGSAREKYLCENIEAVKASAEALVHKLRIQDEQHRSALDEKNLQIKKVKEFFCARELKLVAHLKGVEGARFRLLQGADRLREQVAAMQLSLSWRLTAPARTLVTYFLPPNASPSAPFEHVPTNHHLGLDTFAFDDQISSAVFPPDAYNIMQSTVSSVMPEDIKVGSTTHDFMAYSDQEFLRSAYQLVLGRHPDAGGSLHFHSQMASGISRLHILAQLRLSPEGKARSTTFPELDGVLATATNAKACATSFADLLAFQGSTFIRAVYVTLLGREPDDGGMENWLGQMREGATKLEVLALLQESTEAQSWAARLVDISHAVGQYQSTQKMSPDPDGESSAPRTAPPMTQSIEELLTLPAPEFVLAAFWILLGRSPDPEAFGAYLAHLDAGVLRLRLLADIHASGEAAARRSFLSQIASQTGRSRLAATPVIGLLAQLFVGRIEKKDGLSRRLRGLAFENTLQSERFERYVSRTELEISALKASLLNLKECARLTSQTDNAALVKAGASQSSRPDSGSPMESLLANQVSAWKK